MYRLNLVALLPFLQTVLYSPLVELSPVGEAHRVDRLPYMPGPFPSATYSGYIDIS